MRDVEGGRGRGFDHNVGRKGAEKVGKEQNLVVPEKIFFVTKLISKKEITLTDMAVVRGFISMTIHTYIHTYIHNFI